MGLQFVDRAGDWPGALAESLKYDSEVVVGGKDHRPRNHGRHLERSSAAGGGGAAQIGNFDYKNKYTAGATEAFCPADFDAATTQKIQAAALGAFRAIGGRDYARVDVMVRADGSPVVLEVNTLPGMTETSLLPKAAATAGLKYAELCQRMVDLALCERKRKNDVV